MEELPKDLSHVFIWIYQEEYQYKLTLDTEDFMSVGVNIFTTANGAAG